MLVPINTVATFECIAQCFEACEVIWYTENEVISTQQGFNIQHLSAETDGIHMEQHRVSVNSSFIANNTRLRCIVENIGNINQYARSDTAVLQLISGKCIMPTIDTCYHNNYHNNIMVSTLELE